MRQRVKLHALTASYMDQVQKYRDEPHPSSKPMAHGVTSFRPPVQHHQEYLDSDVRLYGLWPLCHVQHSGLINFNGFWHGHKILCIFPLASGNVDGLDY
eukprot:6492730-Amphidinium_carterae.2